MVTVMELLFSNINSLKQLIPVTINVFSIVPYPRPIESFTSKNTLENLFLSMMHWKYRRKISNEFPIKSFDAREL